jgi:hypothetical protein
MFLGIETVNGAGVQSGRAMAPARTWTSASEAVGDDGAVESVRIERAWLAGFRGTMTLFQNCL